MSDIIADNDQPQNPSNTNVEPAVETQPNEIPQQGISDDAAAKEYLDWSQRRFEFHESGLHRFKTNEIHEKAFDIDRAYQNDTVDMPSYKPDPNFYKRLYSAKLAEIDKQERNNSDFNFGANYMAMVSTVNQDLDLDLREKLKAVGIQRSILNDEKTFNRLAKSMLYESYVKNLKGRELPNEFFHDERFLKQSPETQYALVELNAANNILNGTWKKPDMWSTAKGYEMSQEKFEVREALRKGQISDIDAVRQLKRINFDYEEDGFWNNVFSGFGAFGAEIVSGLDVVEEGASKTRALRKQIDNKYNEMIKAEPSLFDKAMVAYSGAKLGEIEKNQYSLTALAFGQADAESRVHQLDQVSVMKAKKPALSLTYLMDKTESDRRVRALMFGALNIASFIPIPVTQIGKGIGVAGKAAANAVSRVAPKVTSLGDIVSAGIARVTGKHVEKKMAATAAAQQATKEVAKETAEAVTENTVKQAIKVGNKDLALAALGTFAATTATESALQGAIEGVSAAQYTSTSNEVLAQDESLYKAFFKAASESFVDNLLVSTVMGAPHAIANIGTIAKEIAVEHAKLESLKAQESYIDNALKSGAAPQQINQDKLEHKEYRFDVEGFQEDVKEKPELLDDVVQILNEPMHPAHNLAERIIEQLKENNDVITKKFNRASSSEAFIVNPVELAALYKDRPNLEQAVKRNRSLNELTERDLLEELNTKFNKALDAVDNEGMFEPDFYKDVLDTDRKLNPVGDQIEADINAKLALPEGANKDFKNDETRNAARFFAPMLTNYILRFAGEMGISPLKFYESLNLKFVAGKRVYNLADGNNVPTGEFTNDNGITIYLSDEYVPETLMHELAHMHLDLLSRSNAEPHIKTMQTLLQAYCSKKGIDYVDSPSKLSAEQWSELQEIYAYGTVFDLARSFERELLRAERFLDLVELATKIRIARNEREAAIARGETPETDGSELLYENLKDEYELSDVDVLALNNGVYDFTDEQITNIKAYGPRINRLTPEGTLRPDIDLITMVGAGLYRHFGDCTTFAEFKDRFTKHYKETYGKDFIELETDVTATSITVHNYDIMQSYNGADSIVNQNYNILQSYRFLNDIERGGYSSKEFTDTFLDPIDGNSEPLKKILGEDFLNETARVAENLRRALLNHAHAVYMANRRTTLNRAEQQKAIELANHKSLDPKYCEANKIYTDAKLLSDKLEFERSNTYIVKKNVDANMELVERAIKDTNAPLTADELTKVESAVKEASAYLNKGELPQPYDLRKVKSLLREYKIKLNAKLDNIRGELKRNQSIAKKAKAKRDSAEKRLETKVDQQMKQGAAIEASVNYDERSVYIYLTKNRNKFKNIIKRELADLKMREQTPNMKLTDVGNFVVQRVESVSKHLENLQNNDVCFSFADLLEHGYTRDEISALSRLGLASEKHPTKSYAQYVLETDYSDYDAASIKPDRRLKDIIECYDRPNEFIFDIISNAHAPEFNEKLIEILEVRKELNEVGVKQMLAICGRLNQTLISKFKHQVNQKTRTSLLKNESERIVYKLGMGTNPYQLVRKGEAYFRRGLKQLAKASNDPNAVDIAVKYFTQAEVLFMASKHLREVKDKIESKKTRLKKTLAKTARNKELGKNYDNDTFIAAKTIGYNMGIIQSKKAYDDIMAYREGKGYLGVTDSEKFYSQLGDSEPRLREIGKNTNAKNIANMTVEEALGTLNKIDSVLNLSRNLSSIRNTQRKANLDSIVDRFLAKIDEYKHIKKIEDSDSKNVSDMNQTKGLRNRLRSLFNTVTMSTQRPSTIIATIEGETDMSKSVLYNTIYGPVMEAEQKLLAKLSDLTNNYVTPMYKKLKELSKNVKLEKPYVIEGVKVDANGVERRVKYVFGANGNILNDVAVMLANMGTESNRQAMCRSLGINEEQLLDHIKKLTDMGVITDDLWIAVRDNIWAPYDEIYTDTARAFNDVYNTMYTKESGLTIILPSGREIEGGYSPLTIARDIADTEIRDPLEGDAYAKANLPSTDGFAKDRVIHDMDMSFDIKDVFYNMKRQETFAFMAQPCVEAYHIINDKRVKAKLEEVMPSSIQVLSNGLATAMSQNSIEFNKGMSNLVSKFAGKSNAALLAYNTTNAAMGFSQIFTALSEIKNPLYIIRGMWDFLTQRPIKGSFTRANVDKASVFMRNRNAFKTQSITRAIDKFDKKSLIGKGIAKLEEYSFVLQSAVQNMCDYVVWNAAYYKTLDSKYGRGKFDATVNGFDVDAVKQADAVVRRTQLSKSNSDLSNYETKESVYSTILTPFSSVFVSMINLSRIYNAAIDHNQVDSNFRKKVNKMAVFMTVWIFPTLIAEYIRGAASGDEFETDPLVSAGLSTIGYRIHPLVGGVTALLGRLLTKAFFDSKEYIPAGIYSSPLEGAIERTAKEIAKIFGDRWEDVNIPNLLAMVGIYVYGYPQLAKIMNYAADYYNDDLYETSTADLIRGFITGKASKEQKGE